MPKGRIAEIDTPVSSGIEVSTVYTKEGHDMLRSLRSGRRGRTSKYEPVFKAVQELERGQVITVNGFESTAQVTSFRTTFANRMGVDKDGWKVKSARTKDGEGFTVVIGRVEDLDAR